ncbi:MAG: hypothetical protein U1A22_02410 [Xanthomonadaceae bacterium]|nr:hypothetical protein [Xanthomonadaceae bacterium]
MTTRRALLKSGAGVAALLLLPGCAEPPAFDPASRAAEIDAIALSLQGFANGSYLDDAHPESLRAQLIERLDRHRRLGMATPVVIRVAIEEDFRDGKIAEIDGWLLSETEHVLLKYSAHLHRLAGSSSESRPVPFSEAEEAEIVTLRNWGPQSTCVGRGFNEQADGHSSIWVGFDGVAPTGLFIMIGDQSVITAKGAGVLTSRIEGDLLRSMLEQERSYAVSLYDPFQGKRQLVGQFAVVGTAEAARTEAGKESTVFKPVARWGPTRTRQSTPFNAQPNGDSAFWINTPCAPHDTMVTLGDTALETTVTQGSVTARLTNPDLLDRTGRLPLRLTHPPTGESVLVGEFEIQPQ